MAVRPPPIVVGVPLVHAFVQDVLKAAESEGHCALRVFATFLREGSLHSQGRVHACIPVGREPTAYQLEQEQDLPFHALVAVCRFAALPHRCHSAFLLLRHPNVVILQLPAPNPKLERRGRDMLHFKVPSFVDDNTGVLLARHVACDDQGGTITRDRHCCLDSAGCAGWWAGFMVRGQATLRSNHIANEHITFQIIL